MFLYIYIIQIWLLRLPYVLYISPLADTFPLLQFLIFVVLFLQSGGQRPMSGEPMSKKLGPPLDARMEQSAADLSNFETTFDVDGHIETVTREEKPPLSP